MNVDLIKRKLWDVVRPLHSPLTKAARRRLGRNYSNHPEMELPPAYEAMQLEAERRLHTYLHVDADEIQNIVIVGAHNGDEVPRLRRSYPKSRFLCLEPSPQWYQQLTETFQKVDYVKSRKLALSDGSGRSIFYELPLAGNGSLLPPDSAHWSRFNKIDNNEVTRFEVTVSTLDREAAELDKIDLLWIDVQGAEGRVLKGATATLPRVRAVFMEVAVVDSPYQGALLLPELEKVMQDFGFRCVGLGIDGWNYSGNALWIRPVAQATNS